MGDAVASVARRERMIEVDLPLSVDFALIGHQESWRAAADVLAVLRGPERTPLPDDEIKDILPWIPPRVVCHVDVGSIISTKNWGAKAHGLYIDSFIPPDRLEAAYVHENIARVRGAAACAIQAGAKIVSLGGFSSILIEGNFDQLPERQDTVFTTGNTLTVAFIVQGIKKMCALEGRDISRSTLLIVGATGDVGSGCARCLAPIVRRVLLSARNVERLHRLAAELEADGILNRHPFPDVVHGCLLEGMALALEHRFEPFSQGRGFITRERVDEIETIAARHGIYLAPLYNADGPVEDGTSLPDGMSVRMSAGIARRSGAAAPLSWTDLIRMHLIQ